MLNLTYYEMGGNGSFASGATNLESNRRFKTIFDFNENIKILEMKNSRDGVKLPEESHTKNRVYAIFYKNGKGLKAVGVYGNDGKKLFEIHTIDHKGLGPHYHVWDNGRPSNSYPITAEMRKLLDKIINFKRNNK